MMIDLYHLAKTPIGIWCIQNSNLDPLFDNKELYDVNPLKVYWTQLHFVFHFFTLSKYLSFSCSLTRYFSLPPYISLHYSFIQQLVAAFTIDIDSPLYDSFGCI